MQEDLAVCRIGSCPAPATLARIFESDQYTKIVTTYKALIDDDPEYLTYHWMSTAMRLQYILKSTDLPDLQIGDCIDPTSCTCCVVEALQAAIHRRSHNGTQAARSRVAGAGND